MSLDEIKYPFHGSGFQQEELEVTIQSSADFVFSPISLATTHLLDWTPNTFSQHLQGNGLLGTHCLQAPAGTQEEIKGVKK